MIFFIIFFSLFLTGCGGSSTNEKPVPEPEKKISISLSDTGRSSTWYEIPQYYDGVPKYSGAFGTYTAKHTPIAIKHNGKTYYTYSDNSDGVLRIFVSDETDHIEVHYSTYLNDPHSNATISVDAEGHIMVYVSARGAKELGAVYRSVEPESISEFQHVTDTWMAYPQPWETPQGQIVLHTLYERYENRNQRQLYVTSDQCTKKLVEGGHYQMSTYDGSRLHTVYNFHPGGNVDQRTGLYYMYSDDGCTWFNKAGQVLELPVEPDSDLTRILKTDKFIYLKDIGMKGLDPRILYTESDSFDPTVGTRELFLTSIDGPPILVNKTGHNYNVGYYHYDSDFEYVVYVDFAPEEDRKFYAGGNLQQKILKSDGSWEVTPMMYVGYFNYARKVFGGDGEGFVSQEIDHNSGRMIKVEISYNF